MSVPCPKCGKTVPITEAYSHYSSCSALPTSQSSYIWPQQPESSTSSPVTHSTIQQPQSITQVTPKLIQSHQHTWLESDLYRVCIACNTIRPKLKALWFIFVRYFFAIFWIALFIGVVIGLTAARH